MSKYKQRSADWRALPYIVGRPINLAKRIKRADGYTQLPLQLSPGYPQVIPAPPPEAETQLSPENAAPTGAIAPDMGDLSPSSTYPPVDPGGNYQP